MTKRLFGNIILVVFMVFAGVFSWSVYLKEYVQEDTVNVHLFPTQIGGWVSEEMTVTDEEKAILETDNVFVRRYYNPQGDEVYLFIVYSQTNRKVSHPPEVCYTGAGASILNKSWDMIEPEDEEDKLVVNKLFVEQGKFEQILFYWFKVGDSFTTKYWKQQALIAYKSFFNQPSSSALIRISTTIQREDRVKATKLLHDFGEMIIPSIRKYLP